MSRLLPETIAGRAILVLLVGLTVSHILSMALYITDRASARMLTGGEHVGERIATILRLVENSSLPERERIVELANDPTLRVTLSAESAIEADRPGGWRTDVLRRSLIAHLGQAAERPLRIRYIEASRIGAETEESAPLARSDRNGSLFHVSLQLADGTWLNFVAPIGSSDPFWSLHFGLSILVMVLAVAVLSYVVVQHLTRPLRVFAQAAEKLGVDVDAPRLPETGPREVRHAAHAFNEMQDRIRRFVADRTQMVAAISHDLRTPITRLRLRAELVEDSEEREKIFADLDEMERMISGTLSFARDDSMKERPAVVDLTALVQRVCDDLVDAGMPVAFDDSGSRLPYPCRPTAMRRALSNLIENAAKYGGRARVTLAISDGKTLVISIDDGGPGIPQDRQDDVFRPFFRLEGSRSRETGGTGLGLTVARTIVHAHGGEIFLKNRPEGGLRAEVRLPK